MSRCGSAWKTPDAPYWSMMRAAEADIIQGALETTRGRVADAARLLGVPVSFLRRRAATHGIAVSWGGKPPSRTGGVPPEPITAPRESSPAAAAHLDHLNRDLKERKDKEKACLEQVSSSEVESCQSPGSTSSTGTTTPESD